MSNGWPLHPKNFAMIMAVVFFAILIALVVCESGLPQPPSWYLTGTAILSVLGGSCFTAWLSMSIYEFITKQEQERRHKREFDVDLVKTLYGPLYDELMRVRDRLLDNFDFLGLDQLHALHFRYLRLLVPVTLIERGKGLEALAAEYRTVFASADQTLNRRGAEIAKSFTEERGGILNMVPISGNVDALAGGEWRAVLGTADSGPKSMFDRLAAAVNGAAAPGKEPVTREFMDQFIEGIKNEPIARRIVEIRDSLRKLILEVIAELGPLIQTPYLGRGASQ